MLEASYDLLRTMPPFRGWRLPPAHEVEFQVIKHKDISGDCWHDGDNYVIRISDTHHGKIESLLTTMAHEMCHVRQRQAKTKDREHGKVFKRLAASVCRQHGFDPKLF